MDFAPAIFTGIASIVVIFYKLPFFLAAFSILVVPIGVLIVYLPDHHTEGPPDTYSRRKIQYGRGYGGIAGRY